MGLEPKRHGYPSSSLVSSSKLQISTILKAFGITSFLLLIFCILCSLIQFLISGQNTYYTILFFSFDNYESSFQTHAVSLYISSIIIILGASSNLYALITLKDEQFTSIFSKEIALFIILINFLLSFSYITGIIFQKNLIASCVILSFSILGLFFSIIIFKKIKSKRNFSIMALISQNIYSSILMSFFTYLVLFGLIECSLFKINKHDSYYQELRSILAITAICIYGSASIVCLSTVKDVVYSLLMFNFLIGYIATSPYLTPSELITGFSVMGFILFAIFVTVIRYRKAAFGYDDSDELMQNLRIAQDMVSSRC